MALLKRWTSGGEFCSDAHRQQYQEEYNQLALNRLLQAKPEVKSTAPAPAEPKQPEPEPEPVKAVAAVAATAVEERVPIEPGFLVELPLPVMAKVRTLVVSEPDLVQNAAPTIPGRDFEAWETQLVPAGKVELAPSTGFVDCAARPSERRLDVRDFVRNSPSVEVDLRAAGEAGLLENFEDTMEILIFPHPPQGSPPLWQEPNKEFREFETELGDLARLTFQTTGFEEIDGGNHVKLAGPAQSAVIAEPPPVPKPAPPEPLNETPGSIELPKSQDREMPPVIHRPATAPPPHPAHEVAREREVIVRVTTPFLRQPLVSRPAQARTQPVIEKAPDLVTKPLPLTLHGLAAGRGKPVQLFPSVVSSGIAIQIPRPNALPLRPLMTLEPAPPPPTEVTAKPEEKKADTRKLQPVRQDPRFTSGKARRPDVRILGLDSKGLDSKGIAKEPEKKQPEKKDPEPKLAPVAAAPPAAATPPPDAWSAADLGLPSLSMEASGGFWRKLPVAGKAGIAALFVLSVAGVIGLTMKGTGTAASTGPRIVEADPLPTGESGWITDWGADPGVRRQRQISILRPSLNLTDYRMEFQAQIETRAIGWVFRAMDPKNFYVEKLEIVKPGLEPGVALVRFAVINGDEQPRAQFPLTLPVRLDTLYKIRFQAVGDHFMTWVQDQKIDDWTDSRIKTGGVGLYNERGERASLKGGVNVVPLMIKK